MYVRGWYGFKRPRDTEKEGGKDMLKLWLILLIYGGSGDGGVGGGGGGVTKGYGRCRGEIKLVVQLALAMHVSLNQCVSVCVCEK